MLDFLGEREPFYEPIAKIATLAEKDELTMVVSPISFATVNYFLSKYVFVISIIFIIISSSYGFKLVN